MFICINLLQKRVIRVSFVASILKSNRPTTGISILDLGIWNNVIQDPPTFQTVTMLPRLGCNNDISMYTAVYLQPRIVWEAYRNQTMHASGSNATRAIERFGGYE